MDDWTHTEAVATALTVADSAVELLERQIQPGNRIALLEHAFLRELFSEMKSALVDREAVLARALGYPHSINSNTA
ncbi:MAG: hypothetical protein EON93_04545 [Burkholderiales bacterium]|nr:MAG: hypothetical protein EON93_04545 [Burkholderiales bacterium]